MSDLNSLRKCSDKTTFSKLLGYSQASLSYILFGRERGRLYTEFEIAKASGGVRKISAPDVKLKALQERLASVLNACLNEIDSEESVPAVSQAFRNSRSIYSNGLIHKRQTWVINFDLENFFGSINFGRVRGFFISNKNFLLDEDVATLIAQISCHNNELPQGAPTSPVISNLLARGLDRKLLNHAIKNKMKYSRYADDITFSTSKWELPKDVGVLEKGGSFQLSEKVENVVRKSGFEINHSKTRCSVKCSRQQVTGLIVNRKVNVPTEYYRTFRAQLNKLKKNGKAYFKKNGEKHELTIEQLLGKAAFIYQIKWKSEKRLPVTSDTFIFTKNITLPSYIKSYRELFLLRLISAQSRPVIITEGKTDVTHLKLAIKRRCDLFSKLGTQGDDKFEFKVSFFDHHSRAAEFIGFKGSETSNGASGIAAFIAQFRITCDGFPALDPQNPLIILTDNDSGLKTIMSSCKSLGVDITPSDESDFFKLNRNLYLIKTNSIQGKIETCIEDLHSSKTLNAKVDGKQFNLQKKHKDHSSIGKQRFAEYVAKTDGIDFSGFDILLSRIEAVLIDFGK